MSGDTNFKSIYDEKFDFFYRENVISFNPILLTTEIKDSQSWKFSWLSDYEKRKSSIPEDYQKVFELYRKLSEIFKSTDNMQELLCPDLIKVITSNDFYKKYANSLDKNKKIQPKVLFGECEKRRE